MIPIRYEGETAIFTNHQVDDYGLPDEWGFEDYLVIEDRSTMNFATDFKLEQSYYKRPVHRYSRLERFETTLQQLMGEKGKVPDHVMTIVSWYVKESPDMWNAVRKVLKHFKWRLYYNRIPYIVHQLTQKPSVNWSRTYDQYQAIIADFQKLCYLFDQKKELLQRKYFPNMRFIALKLLEKHGVTFEYPIPLTRTSRKLKDLEYIWGLLNCHQ